MILKMDKKGVSAIIIVILMVAITVAIACTVYICLSIYLESSEQYEQQDYIYGNLTSIQHIDENNFFVVLDNNTYILNFDRYEDEYYSFTVGNYYLIRYPNIPISSVTLVIEITKVV